MDLVLVSITGMSLVLALAMGIVVLRLLREERQRADARVALLLAATVPAGAPADLAIRPADTLIVDPGVSQGPGALFSMSSAPSPWRPRLAAAAGMVLVVFAAAAVSFGRGSAPRAAAAPADGRIPLELVGLAHTHGSGALEIRGVVRNPPGATPLSTVIATAQAFGPDGNLLAAGRAPLDFATLPPGEESPFVMAVPVSGATSRYRIGFRSADGRPIPHVDRRIDTSPAHTARGTGEPPWSR